jgi:D-cysteine desulfhydrase
MSPPRLTLAHLPTPLVPAPRLSERLKIDLSVKRDDATGGAEAGNKIRKLEYLLADAMAKGADTIVTCGGIQSNHARATAVVCAQLGLGSVLMLRETGLSDAPDEGVARRDAGVALTGNLLLDELVGADARLITADAYRRRMEVMEAAAEGLRAAGRHPYVVPEGGSNGCGALGYVQAMAEVAAQSEPFDVVFVACGSGGTVAGIALGAAAHGAAKQVVGVAVCNDEAYFRERVSAIIEQARTLDPELPEPVPWRIDARFKGPAYGVSTPEQRESMIVAAREGGLVLDPVYSGKAFHGLASLAAADLTGQRVLFVHTGGLPGLLAQSAIFDERL